MLAVAGNAFLWVKNSTRAQSIARGTSACIAAARPFGGADSGATGIVVPIRATRIFVARVPCQKAPGHASGHKCAYCNSAVIGYMGGFHNRHCKKHSCLVCLNGTTSATAQVCQNHACRHPRCFGRCRRGIADDVRGRADRDGRCANCWSRPHLYGNPYCQPCHEDHLRRREEKDRQWDAEERRLEAEENPRRLVGMQ